MRDPKGEYTIPLGGIAFCASREREIIRRISCAPHLSNDSRHHGCNRGPRVGTEVAIHHLNQEATSRGARMLAGECTGSTSIAEPIGFQPLVESSPDLWPRRHTVDAAGQ